MQLFDIIFRRKIYNWLSPSVFYGTSQCKFLSYIHFLYIFQGGIGFYHAGKGTQLTMGIAKTDVSFSYINSYASSYAIPTDDPRLKPLFKALMEAL